MDTAPPNLNPERAFLGCVLALFPNQRDGPTRIRVDHGSWKALLKRAGVRDARLHDARHTAATMLLVLGIPQRAVMDVMGWSESSMAARYQHITAEVTEAIAQQVLDRRP